MLTRSMMRGLAAKLDLTDLLQPKGREREHQLIMRQLLLLMVGTKINYSELMRLHIHILYSEAKATPRYLYYVHSYL